MEQANPQVMEYPTGLVNINAVNSKFSHEVKQEAWQDKIMPDVLQKGTSWLFCPLIHTHFL